MRAFVVLLVVAITRIAVGQPLGLADERVLVTEHRAHERAVTLGVLAVARGSEDVRVLGRDLVRDTRFADDQLAALARRRGVSLDAARTAAEIAEDAAARDMRDRLAALEGDRFDRAVLAEIASELGRELAWIDRIRTEPRDPEIAALVTTMRPMLVHYAAEASWLARRYERSPPPGS